MAHTVEILKRERATLDRGAKLLLEKETLDEPQLGEILKDVKAIEPPPAPEPVWAGAVGDNRITR